MFCEFENADCEIIGFNVISFCYLLLQADSLRVHGVAIPTAVGIRNVIGAHKDGKQAQVLWISLREEPVFPFGQFI